MALVTRELLEKPIPLKEKTVSIDGLGDVRLREMSFAEQSKLSLWLYPGDELDKEREQLHGLRRVVQCLIDEKGNRLFEFENTKAGNAEFIEWAKGIQAGAVGFWPDLIYEVRVLHGDVATDVEEADDLKKK
jgi:hypothetical protein